MTSSISKMLLIGDENARDAIGVMLARENLVPIRAADAQTGLEQVFTARPHLVILDWPNPGLTRHGECGIVHAVASVPDPDAHRWPQPDGR